MKLIITIVVLGLAFIFAPLLFPPDRQAVEKSQENLPWNIQSLPDGHSKVFGLELGRATMADARARFGPDIELAIILPKGGKGSLEAYVYSATLGFVTGKLIFAADLPETTIMTMAERAAKSEFMESTTRKLTLDGNDLPTAWAATIRTISFIPSINLDEDLVIQRFGRPTERIPGLEDSTHLLYADKGVDVVVSTHGKELIQYVAPAHFALLRTPLGETAADAGPSAAAR